MTHPIPSAEELRELIQWLTWNAEAFEARPDALSYSAKTKDMRRAAAILESLAAILAEDGMPELAAYYEPDRRDVPHEVVSSEDYDTLRAYTNAQAIKLREARNFAENAATKYNELLANQRILRCAFCDAEYPPDTPPTQHDALTTHVMLCPKHPMRNVEAELREAKKDAERYQWLRLASVDVEISNAFVNICESEPVTPEAFDAAIDAALASAGKE